MQFKSEKERIAHPQAKLILASVWHYIFKSQLTKTDLFFFTEPLESLIHEAHDHLSDDEKKRALYILLIREPTLELNTLLTFIESPPKLYTQEIFDCAVTLGLDKLLNSIKIKYNSGFVLKCIKADDYAAFRWAAANGHLATLEWLAKQVPDELQTMITEDDCAAFRQAAANGHLATLEWLAKQVPDELQAMIQADKYAAFRWAAANGHLATLEWLAKQTQDELQTMIKAKDYDAFARAAANGHLTTLEWLAKQAQDKLQAMINKAKDYNVFSEAAKNGHTATLEWLAKQAPDELLAMIQAYYYAAFRRAAENGHLATLEWLAKKAPDEVQTMIQALNCAAFRWAARNGHSATLKWLAKQAPDKLQAMIQKDNYYAFLWAATNRHTATVSWLFSQSTSCFAYAESHRREYGTQYVAPYINSYLTELHKKADALPLERPNDVFDLDDDEQAKQCFYIMRHLIRCNDRTMDDELLFLLNIPRVKALAHQAITPRQDNELLRLALSTQNTQAAAQLLSIKAVRRLAEQNNYYESEQRGQLSLRDLAQNRESSMTGLTSGEQKRLEGAIKHYEPTINTAGVSHLMNELRATLLERYEKKPATITIKDKKIVLPALWKDLQALQLDKTSYQEALKAYHQHPEHTAWRYISKPNPWMSPDALYVNVSPNNPNERWSTFDEYQSLIVMLWLAAIDETIEPTDGQTLEGRIDNFIKELAQLGRAHNWDKSRQMSDGKRTEEYDDNEGDDPSCFSGVKRRLFQSVMGHPLLSILTMDTVRQELRDFVRAHFDAVIKNDPESKATFLKAYEDYVLYLDDENIDALKPLNLTEKQHRELITHLGNKYQASFTEEPKYLAYIKDQLSLTDTKESLLNAYHALKLDGLTLYLSDMLQAENRNKERAKLSEKRFFSGGVKEHQSQKPSDSVEEDTIRKTL